MANMIAWSNIVTTEGEAPEEPVKLKTIKPGEEVSQADLGASDEEWEALQAQGVVREQPYPENITGSPNEYFREQLTKAAQGELTKEELQELKDTGVLPGVEAPTSEKETKTTENKSAEATK